MKSHKKDTLHTQVILSPQAFKIWADSIRRFSFSSTIERLEFRLEEFSRQENEHISKTVNSYYNACGCSLGSFVMSMTFVALIVRYFLLGNSFQSIGWKQVCLCIGYTLIGALIGKIIGLGFAKIKLIRYTDLILNTLSYINTVNTKNHSL